MIVCRSEFFWSKDSTDLPRSFVDFLQIFSDKTAASLKSLVRVVYYVNAERLHFNKECEAWVFKRGQCSMLSYQDDNKNGEGMTDADIERPLQPLYPFYKSNLLDVSESI